MYQFGAAPYSAQSRVISQDREDHYGTWFTVSETSLCVPRWLNSFAYVQGSFVCVQGSLPQGVAALKRSVPGSFQIIGEQAHRTEAASARVPEERCENRNHKSPNFAWTYAAVFFAGAFLSLAAAIACTVKRPCDVLRIDGCSVPLDCSAAHPHQPVCCRLHLAACNA